jgi:16S rRNA (guanine527-N7)-methyltransferase
MRVPNDARASPEGRLLAGLIALKLDPALAEPLLAYLGQLVRWNEAYSLTSVREPAEMVTRHLLDSLVVLPFVTGRVVDIGAGAGLPGIPLAIANKSLHVTLLDSNGKKARFLRHVQRTLSLANVEIVEQRAEKFRPPQPYDAIITRAFGSLEEFLTATADLGGAAARWLAMKGKLDTEELAAAPVGFEISETRRIAVPGLDEERHVVVVRGAGSRLPAPRGGGAPPDPVVVAAISGSGGVCPTRPRRAGAAWPGRAPRPERCCPSAAA